MRMMAAAYSQLGAPGQMLPNKAFEMVHQYADKALRLDNSIAEGYIAKGSVYLFSKWKWEEAYEALQKAKNLNPGSWMLTSCLPSTISNGRKRTGGKIMEEAGKMDPLSPLVFHTLANMYIFAVRYDEAIHQAEKLLVIDPKMRVAIEKGLDYGNERRLGNGAEVF